MATQNPPSPSSIPRREQLRLTFIAGTTAFLTIIFVAIIAPEDIQVPALSLHLSFLFLGIIFRIIYIYAPSNYQLRINSMLQKLFNIYQSLATEQKLYINLIILILFTILVYIIAGLILAKFLLTIVFVFLAFIAIRDILRWYKALSENLLGKAVIAIGFAIASNLAYGMASQLVSDMVHVTPTNFLRTTLFIALLMIPVLMALAGSIAFAIGSAISSLIIVFSVGPGLDKFRHWLFAGTWPIQTLRFAFITRFFQLIFYLVILSIISSAGSRNFVWYEKTVSAWIPNMIFNLDMYRADECQLKNDVKLAPLGDGKFLIAQKSADGIKFLPPVKCADLPSPKAELFTASER